MDLEAFTREVSHVASMRPQWRHGQVLFNVLGDHDRVLTEEIRGTDADPFHAESSFDWRVALFWAKVVARSQVLEGY